MNKQLSQTYGNKRIRTTTTVKILKLGVKKGSHCKTLAEVHGNRTDAVPLNNYNQIK